MKTTAIISIAFLVAGLALNVFVFLSIPLSLEDNFYIAEIDFNPPINGTLNTIFPFQNLIKLRVSLLLFAKLWTA